MTKIESELFEEMARWPIFDPHTHIDPHRPAARHFDEVLGYHYYTELAHAAGMPADRVAPELDPDTRARNLAEYLDRHFRDPRLKALLASQWLDYGLPPGASAFATHALIATHYLNGAWYPEGGAGTIAEILA